ncbi:Dop1p KNAG_0I00930 [Huiozyma naganishii CBS 8797]|uniref:Uncharacterized protein n=1 Tax=Huiozyma naganishii (strain ATCC MYA-139 / BCRC 22969 / CBS 8797 / KCTC 17520 / NBRC 10181 / NCYC 3082 / Yp74L-3) TaxID=1071383 RepID=J7S931_HUIN7|nr:hypothetical protein KNAG_0I00930 [Kazachstania naganishii CBS 8797]CCK71884.1 hypothetical protein KNAG_0I00930 [Kazachstania naganishii CBS 8797]
MSLALKPLTIDVQGKQLDSKQKKFHSNVKKALERFDLVTEWADYIASLGALLKALQSWQPQFSNVKYYVPSPYEVSRRLTSSLSPELPAGVHNKTLEVYTYIFENIGLEALASECNIWIPGILPLMSYASMSVRSTLIEVYDTYLVQLPSQTLQVVVRPLLASLFPGVDDESSEFLGPTLKLIETLQENLGDDSLFWQTCFIIMMANKERRLGGLVWLTRKLPSLNAVPHLVAELNKTDAALTKNRSKDTALALLLPQTKKLLKPEPGLLIRCFVCALDQDNDLLIKRGALDLLLQRLHLNSPVLTDIVNAEDLKLLVMSCCKTTLAKDMSLNRRVWNWLLGPSLNNNPGNDGATTPVSAADLSINNSKYFMKYGIDPLINGLEDMISTADGILVALRVCLLFMDRWEIGSHVIPKMFITLLRGTEKFQDNEQVMKAANTFFDAVETFIIWSEIFKWVIQNGDFAFLQFVLANFHITGDEEIIVRHLPPILLAILSFFNIEQNRARLPKNKQNELISQILEFLPERAFLPLSNSKLSIKDDHDPNTTLKVIDDYYSKIRDSILTSDDNENPNEITLPFATADLTFLIVYNVYELLLRDLKVGTNIKESSKLFVAVFEKVPEHNDEENKIPENWSLITLTDKIFETLRKDNSPLETDALVGVLDIYSHYLFLRMPLLESIKMLNLIVSLLWEYMLSPNWQGIAIKSLKSLIRTVPTENIEAALCSAFKNEKDVTKRLLVLDLLWVHSSDYAAIIRQPLELILDVLFDDQNPYYLTVSKWILSLLNSGTSNRLYQILTDELSSFPFLNNDTLGEFDDLEMFAYRVQVLINVLHTNDALVMKNFSTELTPNSSLDKWKNQDVSTYKNLTIAILMKFLALENNSDAKSIRSTLILLNCLLDGTEENFKDYIIFFLKLVSKYVTEINLEGELIAVSLLDMVSKILRLSHNRGMKLEIFTDDDSHLKFIDFLVTSISKINNTLVITSYVKLLSESITYFGNSLFDILLPLTASIIQCIQRFLNAEKEKGGYYQSISLLLGALEDILKVSHSLLSMDEKDSYFSGVGNTGDFLQSVVSNVFSNENQETGIRTQGERDVIIQAFKQVTVCSLDIWTWAHKTTGVIGGKSSSTPNTGNYNAYKFKFRSKKLLETLFLLEPMEVLENLIVIESSDMVITLIHVLDGNKPSLTIPFFFFGIISRYNKGSVTKFSIHKSSKGSGRLESSLIHKLKGETLMDFLVTYAKSLENTAVEEFYNDFISFFKDIALNYTLYKPIAYKVIEFIGIIAEKLQKTQFNQQKHYKKELSDIFVKYLPNAIAELPSDALEKSKALTIVRHLVSKVQYIVNDTVGGDRFSSIISIIVSQCLTTPLKYKGEKDSKLSDDYLTLATSVSEVGAKVKNWKALIAEIFQDEKKSPCFGENKLWNSIIYEWSQYPDNKTKLLADLLLVTGSKRMGMTPALITFNSWNDSEVDAKCQNMLKISYLLIIAPVDTYLLDFQSLISCVCQYLVGNDSKIKTTCWILLRVLFLRFSVSHFNDYWGTLSYCLQTNLQEFCESVQIQQNVDCNLVLQVCKTLDLLLALGYEGFTSTNEWLFIIDTVNCIFKTYPYVALVDKISEFKEYGIGQIGDIELTESKELRLPLLCGVHSITKQSQLRNFFSGLSYSYYESMYSLKPLDTPACETDVFEDIFAQV